MPVYRNKPAHGAPASSQTHGPTNVNTHNAATAAAARAPSDQTRDAILTHIQQRLDQIQTVVAREDVAARAAQRDAHDIVDRTKADVTAPDATRWHEATRAYLRAAEAAAGGDLVNAARRLHEAEHLERQAMHDTSATVDLRDVHTDPRHPWRDKVPRMPAERVVVPLALRQAVENILTHDDEAEGIHGRILRPKRTSLLEAEEEEDESDDS